MGKVMIINGSPHIHGCTARALKEVEKMLLERNIETEWFQVGKESLRGCLACGYCHQENHKGCVLQDIVVEASKKFEEADGLLIGSPVYYASANGNLISFLDRLFYSSRFDKTMKVGACVVSARRAGNTATFDELNKYFSISNMPIATSQYWNMVHGNCVEEVEQDLEGLQTMRTLGKNMAFLIESISLGKEKYGLPSKEKRVSTNFIH